MRLATSLPFISTSHILAQTSTTPSNSHAACIAQCPPTDVACLAGCLDTVPLESATLLPHSPALGVGGSSATGVIVTTPDVWGVASSTGGSSTRRQLFSSSSSTGGISPTTTTGQSASTSVVMSASSSLSSAGSDTSAVNGMTSSSKAPTATSASATPTPSPDSSNDGAAVKLGAHLAGLAAILIAVIAL